MLSLDNKLGIFRETELRLSAKVTNSKIDIFGFYTFRHDRNHKGVGVFIYCDQSVNLKLLLDHKPNIEAISVKVHVPLGITMIICCIYSNKILSTKWLNDFYSYTSQITILCPRILLFGDFNID